MKPLLSKKVTRENKDERDWESADDQLTDAGRDAFKARQDARIKAAQKQRESKVQPIIKKRTA